MMLPVFLFTGFLDGGKTSFVQSLLEDPSFNGGERTLLLLCEQGEEEYDPSRYSIDHVSVVPVESVASLTPDKMKAWQSKFAATRVIVEYNGMWQMNDLFDRLPENWGIAQETLLVDGSTALAYNANMRQLLVDKLRTAEMVVFNRVAPEADRMELHKIVRGISRTAAILYETTEGKSEQDDIADPLPFDLEAPVVEIADVDYALFYRDLIDEPQKYEGKTVRYKAILANTLRFPRDTFLAGRHIMECCAADIRYCPLVCKWDMAKSCKHKSWAVVQGKLSQQFSNIYGKKGPVLTIQSVTPAAQPEEPVATFY